MSLLFDVSREVRVSDVDGDVASDYPPNFGLRKRHWKQGTCPWLGQVRQTAEKRYFCSRQ